MHFLLYWPSENSYTAVAGKKVKFYNLDNSLCDTSDVGNMIGCLFRIEYGSGTSFNGQVLNAGTKKEMKNEEMKLSAEAAEKSFEIRTLMAAEREVSETKKSRKRKRESEMVPNLNNKENESNDIVNADQDVLVDERTEESTENSGIIGEETPGIFRDQKIQKLEEENTRLQLHVTKLQRMIRKKAVATDSDKTTMMDLGSGVKIPEWICDWAKLTCSANPSIYLRKLVFDGGLFSLEEIASSSMTGRKPLNGEAKPAINSTKFKAIKDHVISTFGLVAQTYEMVMFEKRIKNICTDARKKLSKKPH